MVGRVSDDMSESLNQDMILGEMRGQLREVVHSLNNLTQKFDTLSREVIGLAGLGAEMMDMRARLAILETDRNRRDGALGAADMVIKSPMLGWVVGAIATGVAFINGWVKIP